MIVAHETQVSLGRVSSLSCGCKELWGTDGNQILLGRCSISLYHLVTMADCI